jgi:hypothetical protein
MPVLVRVGGVGGRVGGAADGGGRTAAAFVKLAVCLEKERRVVY